TRVSSAGKSLLQEHSWMETTNDDFAADAGPRGGAFALPRPGSDILGACRALPRMRKVQCSRAALRRHSPSGRRSRELRISPAPPFERTAILQPPGREGRKPREKGR